MPPHPTPSRRKASDPKSKSTPKQRPKSNATQPPTSTTSSNAPIPKPSSTSPTPHPAQHLLSLTPLPPTTTASLFTTRILQKPLLLRPSSPPPAPSSTTSNNKTDARTLRQHSRHSHPKKSHHLSRQHLQRKPTPLSAREKRHLGLYDLPHHALSHATYTGLHALWVGYMQEVLGMHNAEHPLRNHPSSSSSSQNQNKARLGSVDGLGSLVSSADLHGAEVEVVRSRDFGRVGGRGGRGIVVRETRGCLVVVCEGGKEEGGKGKGRDVVRKFPKRGSVFRVEVPWPRVRAGAQDQGREEGRGEGGQEREAGGNEAEDVEMEGEEGNGKGNATVEGEEGLSPPPPLTFEIHGSGFEMRPADRARKGFKWKAMEYL
ncbi:MAG: hypothetical protein Q9160_000654 [Pyrenula sp. 1 TL-2023]